MLLIPGIIIGLVVVVIILFFMTGAIIDYAMGILPNGWSYNINLIAKGCKICSKNPDCFTGSKNCPSYNPDYTPNDKMSEYVDNDPLQSVLSEPYNPIPITCEKTDFLSWDTLMAMQKWIIGLNRRQKQNDVQPKTKPETNYPETDLKRRIKTEKIAQHHNTLKKGCSSPPDKTDHWVQILNAA